MADGDTNNSGELSSFLHLTGWRPLILALVAGLAGAFGLFGALSEPAEFQARYVIFADRVAADDLTPAQLDIFVEEIAQTAKFPVVINAVEETTGLIEEEDYTITVNQSGSSVATIDINVVTENFTDARTIAIETGIEALTVTLEKTLGNLESTADQIRVALQEEDARIAELRIEAGGLNPTVAYDVAVQTLIDRRARNLNPPLIAEVDADGNETLVIEPEPEPPIAELEAEVSRLEPVDREYRQRVDVIDGLNGRLADRQNAIRDANAALLSLETEREQPLIISEVVTEETSRIAGLLTGLLIFAVPAALLMILVFTIWDFFRKKPEVPLRRAEDFEPAGVLEAQGTRALPEANFTPLVVVDEDEEDNDDRTDVLADSSGGDDDGGDGDRRKSDDDTSTSKNRRSKDGRWGRDASSKAG
ncbi:MAG: hypothetical protein R8J94_00795 [Acidimicrobiia bacterium]|nr:hypothetical protein [Acidimicrobiia bacterium]